MAYNITVAVTVKLLSFLLLYFNISKLISPLLSLPNIYNTSGCTISVVTVSWQSPIESHTLIPQGPSRKRRVLCVNLLDLSEVFPGVSRGTVQVQGLGTGSKLNGKQPRHQLFHVRLHFMSTVCQFLSKCLKLKSAKCK